MRAFAIAFLLLALPTLATAGETDPAALVRSLYAAQAAEKGPFFQDEDRALVDRYFVKELGDLIWKDANGPEGEVGVLDGDPLYDAQDMEITEAKIGDAVIDGDAAKVESSFRNFGEAKSIVFLLEKQPDGTWLISNIDWGHDRMLEVLREGLGVK